MITYHEAWSQDKEIKWLKKAVNENHLGEKRTRQEQREWLEGYIEGCSKRKTWEHFEKGKLLMKMSQRFITDYAKQMLKQL
jgi:hypothetical protein